MNNNHSSFYSLLFNQLKGKEIHVLELGNETPNFNLKEIFPDATIKKVFDKGGTGSGKGECVDRRSVISMKTVLIDPPIPTYDIIVDVGADYHNDDDNVDLELKTLQYLYKKLKPGGFYILNKGKKNRETREKKDYFLNRVMKAGICIYDINNRKTGDRVMFIQKSRENDSLKPV